MNENDTRDELIELDARIDELVDAVASCRRIIAASKLLIAAGGIVLVGLLVGVIHLEPVALVGAIAAVLGGIVLLGSNASTLKQSAAELAAAEAQRAALVSGSRDY